MAITSLLVMVGIVLFGILLPVGATLIVYFLIRSLIKYHHELKNGKSKQQIELEKMNIEDL